MKKLLVIALLLFVTQTLSAQSSFVFPKASDYPKLKQQGRELADFVPGNWQIMDKAFGDLNGDKLPDCAMIIKDNIARFINKNDGLGTDPFDTNPRILLILFKNSKGLYDLAEQSNSFIYMSDSPTMTEPYQEMKIARGVLQLNFEEFYSAGGWYTSQRTYKFKYIGGIFYLIGADKRGFMRNGGEAETRSYDFLTRKVKVSIEDVFEPETKTEKTTKKVKWRTLPKMKLKTFRTFKSPFTWEIEHDYYL